MKKWVRFLGVGSFGCGTARGTRVPCARGQIRPIQGLYQKKSCTPYQSLISGKFLGPEPPRNFKTA